MNAPKHDPTPETEPADRLMPLIRRACPYPQGSDGWLAWYHGLQFGLAVAKHMLETQDAPA